MLAIDVPKDELRAFCRKWKVRELALFGSVTRPEEFGPDSDVDVLVTFEPAAPWRLFDWVHMEDELAKAFGRRVDLVERAAVEESDNQFRRDSILASVVSLHV